MFAKVQKWGNSRAIRIPKALAVVLLSFYRANYLTVVRDWLFAVLITGRRKGYPFEVPLHDNPDVYGVALADHLKEH